MERKVSSARPEFYACFGLDFFVDQEGLGHQRGATLDACPEVDVKGGKGERIDIYILIITKWRGKAAFFGYAGALDQNISVRFPYSWRCYTNQKKKRKSDVERKLV